MKPETWLVREYSDYLLDNVEQTILEPKKHYSVIEDDKNLSDSLKNTQYSSGVEFVEDCISDIMGHMKRLTQVTDPPIRYRYHPEYNAFLRYDIYCKASQQTEKADLVKCLVNWKSIKGELWDNLSESDFELLCCLAYTAMYNMENPFITRPQGGGDGGIDFGGITTDLEGGRLGLVVDAKKYNSEMDKGGVNKQLGSWKELRYYLEYKREKPSHLPDLPDDFENLENYQYHVVAWSGFGKDPLFQLKREGCKGFNYDQVMWWLFKSLLQEHSDIYSAFFEEELPWTYLNDSIPKWINDARETMTVIGG